MENVSHLINQALDKEQKELNLSKQGLTKLPLEIGQLTNLTTLSLSNNQITEIPEWLGQLTNLTTLSLDNNQITEIPECIGQLTNLTTFYLHTNQITEIPEYLEKLLNLQKLDLRQNPLPVYPEILGLPDLEKEPGSIQEIFNYCRQLRSSEVRPLNEAKLLLVGQGSVGKTSLVNRLIQYCSQKKRMKREG